LFNPPLVVDVEVFGGVKTLLRSCANILSILATATANPNVDELGTFVFFHWFVRSSFPSGDFKPDPSPNLG